MKYIGPNHGIDALRRLLEKLDTPASSAWIRLVGKPSPDNEGTLYKLVENSNEVLRRLGSLEERVRELEEIVDPAPPPPPPPPPPPENRYAPRAYNTALNGSDARFCMDAKYGTVREGAGYRDAMGVLYDEGGRDLGGRTKTAVPGLKTADMMDDKAPCDPYEWMGRWFGGEHGYPPESFLR